MKSLLSHHLKSLPRWVAALSLCVTLCVLPAPLWALDIVVTTTADTSGGAETSLRDAIEAVNAAGGGGHTITFDASLSGGTMSWADNPPIIAAGVSIDGSAASGLTVSGGNTYRVFFVDADAQEVGISNLTIADGQATGGSGGSHGSGGGGGMGAGGGLFVNRGDVILSEVHFANNAATGGNGGAGLSQTGGGGGGGGLQGNGGGSSSSDKAGGGGGGFYGNGGNAAYQGAGGGGGFGGDGGDGSPTEAAGGGGGGGGSETDGADAVDGGAGGTEGGGDGGGNNEIGVAGAEYGGGGGGGRSKRGGVGGRFGGGGGGGTAGSSAHGSAGGEFGGSGGGGGGNSRNGGFGGGSGGSGYSFASGNGGFGAGSGAASSVVGTAGAYAGAGGIGDPEDSFYSGGGGGGGAGLGGAIFVRGTNGATLTFSNVSESGSAVTGGTGGSRYGGNSTDGADGQAVASGMFLMANDVVFNVSSGTQTFAGDIVESTLGEDGGAIAGSSVAKTGEGTLVLTGTNSWSAGTTITEGSLQIGNGGTTGSLGNGDVANNALLVFNRSDAAVFAGNISGGGEVTQAGSGTQTLSGTLSYTGKTSLNAGTLDIGDTDTLVGVLAVGDGDIITTAPTLAVGGIEVNGTRTWQGTLGLSTTLDNSGTFSVAASGNFTLESDLAINTAFSNEGAVTVTGASLKAASISNSGQLTVNGSGFSTLQGAINNGAAGTMTFDSSGPTVTTDTITNDGLVEFTGTGASAIFGDVTNNGTILISGSGVPTFSGNVLNSGSVNVGDTASVIFSGEVSGPGDFTGTGRVFFAGIYTPGMSPSEVNFGGDVTFGPGSHLTIELESLMAGDFDILSIAGMASLNGTLEIAYLNGFEAQPGDSFQILNAGSLNGAFTSVLLPDSQDWFTNYDALAGSLTIGVVPEPSAGLLVLFGLAGLALRRRKRSGDVPVR